MKTSSLLTVLITCGAFATLSAPSAQAQTKTPATALLAKAKVSYADAEKTAMQTVPNATIKESELENEDGSLRWSFDLTTPGSKKITEVGVDAVTGKVVENKVESEKDEADEEKGEKKEHHKKKD